MYTKLEKKMLLLLLFTCRKIFIFYKQNHFILDFASANHAHAMYVRSVNENEKFFWLYYFKESLKNYNSDQNEIVEICTY